MITPDTLEKVTTAKIDLQNARRLLEDLRDKEIKEKGWQPGHGEKPHRVRVLDLQIGKLDLIVDELDELWS